MTEPDFCVWIMSYPPKLWRYVSIYWFYFLWIYTNKSKLLLVWHLYSWHLRIIIECFRMTLLIWSPKHISQCSPSCSTLNKYLLIYCCVRRLVSLMLFSSSLHLFHPCVILIGLQLSLWLCPIFLWFVWVLVSERRPSGFLEMCSSIEPYFLPPNSHI